MQSFHIAVLPKQLVATMDLDVAKKQRKNAKGSITRIESYLEKNKDNVLQLYDYVVREEGLNKAYESFCQAQDFIEDQADENVLEEQQRDLVEEKYYGLKAKLKSLIDKVSSQQSPNVANVAQSPAQSSVQNIQNVTTSKMPEINIEKFTGSQQNWNSFYDLFKALVLNNNQLDDVQKLIYLKSSLKGEPLRLIESLSLVASNLQVALDTLKTRYENRLQTINAHIKNLVNMPAITRNNSSNLREFVVTVRQNTESLKNLNVPIENSDLFLVYILSQKLDFGTRHAYELARGPSELPTLDSFLKFVEVRCLAAENLTSPPQETVSRKTNHFTTSTNHISCAYCNNKNDHTIFKCSKFRELSVNQRKQFVFNKKLCFKCFSPHQVSQCSWKNCPICDQAHNSLLHPQDGHKVYRSYNRTDSPNSRQSSHSNDTSCQKENLGRCVSQNDSVGSHISSENSPVISNHSSSSSSSRRNEFVRENVSSLTSFVSNKCQHVLLATAVVNIPGKDGKMVKARAVLDNGSQVSLATNRLVKKLNYTPYAHTVQVSGISGKKSCNQMIDIEVISRVDPSKKFEVSCSVMETITCKLPQLTIDPQSLEIPDNVELADAEFYSSQNVDLLLGSEMYFTLLTPGLINLGVNFPVLQNTHLGWVIGGLVPQECISNLNVSENVSLFTSTQEITELMQKFWSLEEVPTDQILSNDEELSEQIFTDTTKILENGRFQVNFPLKTPNEHLKLGESFSLAEKRFLALERKLHKDKGLFEEYKNFIDEYVNLNHARYIPLSLKSEDGCNKYFVPHHCVIRNDKITTRLRVVFDASMPTRSGYSLNDITLKGFTVQPELFDILCRFRTFLFAMVADIQKMYRQILINPQQTFLQNILWRNNPSAELQCIELLTVSYGTNFAPYVATRCLKELADKNISTFPLAANALHKQCYMDDVLGGSNSVRDLISLKQQLTELLGSAGFCLHKWCSNSEEFLRKCYDNPSAENYEISFDNSNKVLGIYWNTLTDSFAVTLPQKITKGPITKRSVLSIISQCYDPLGLISPLIVVAKIFMQNIWLSKVTWDEILSDEMKVEWSKFLTDIFCLGDLQIPRCLILDREKIRIELHGYSDASLKAYGACLYLRVLYKNNEVSCNLICAKSRVSPLRTVSLPRLELCACVLLANLVSRMLEVFKNCISVDTVNLWTDSQICLCWLSSHPSKWNIFVSNRVSKIQELTSNSKWRYVQSADNPADHLTRGLRAKDLINCNQWWHGPQYLLKSEINLDSFNVASKLVNIPEERKVTLTATRDYEYLNSVFNKFSSFVKLQRTLAFCLRFCNNTKPGAENISGTLKVSELQNSLNVIIKYIQQKCFSREISSLKNNRAIDNKSLCSLSIFLDDSGIIRVGGRLTNADIPYSQKYPILLPSNNHVVKLMLRREHFRLYHAGPQTVLSNFRLRFWPLNGLRTIKKIIHSCTTCHRFKAQTAQQLMGDLPKDRVLSGRPFLKTGVDFGGPFLLKTSKLRRAPVEKAYIAVFVCMVTKCVHIELVSNLSTEAFLLTLKRFVARRGNPAVIYSDNATNFVGSRNHLKELHDFFKNKAYTNAIEDFLSSNETQWKFIPPRSPHWGGIWEAAIKSAKHHIVRIVGQTTLTFEEFSTVLATIESILNSRPICPLSNDPTDLSCLTPGHFLIGDSLSAYPEKDVSEVSDNRLSTWQKCEKIKQLFWKRWTIEYLNRLQNRPKWLAASKNLKINQVVLLKEDNIHPLKWPLARIVGIMEGADGKVRVVRVRTQDGTFTRSITKICPLPSDNDTENES